MIIDAHAHSDYEPVLGWDDPPEKVVGIMDANGIDKSVIMAYNEDSRSNIRTTYEAYKKFPDRILPFLRVNPLDAGVLDLIDEAFTKYEFKGLKLYPMAYLDYPYGPHTQTVLEKAAEYGVPVIFHCADELFSFPLHIGMAADLCPETKIIMAHMGGHFHTDDAIQVCLTHPNVYVDTSETPYVNKILETIEKVGPDRVLFGTDSPVDNPAVEIEKIRSLHLDKEVEDQVFYKNIAALLHLDIA